MSKKLEKPSLSTTTEGFVASMTAVLIADRAGIHKMYQ